METASASRSLILDSSKLPLCATLATTALGIAAGIDLVRVHDVLPNVRAARISDAVLRGEPTDWLPEGGSS